MSTLPGTLAHNDASIRTVQKKRRRRKVKRKRRAYNQVIFELVLRTNCCSPRPCTRSRCDVVDIVVCVLDCNRQTWWDTIFLSSQFCNLISKPPFSCSLRVVRVHWHSSILGDTIDLETVWVITQTHNTHLELRNGQRLYDLSHALHVAPCQFSSTSKKISDFPPPELITKSMYVNLASMSPVHLKSMYFSRQKCIAGGAASPRLVVILYPSLLRQRQTRCSSFLRVARPSGVWWRLKCCLQF